jgi:hypothetical protein
MIEILPGALFDGKMRKVFVIVILLKNQNTLRRQQGDNALRNGGLSRPRDAANSNHQPLRHDDSSREKVQQTLCRRADVTRER